MISPAATVPSQGLSKAFYIPNFISESEEELLLRKVRGRLLTSGGLNDSSNVYCTWIR